MWWLDYVVIVIGIIVGTGIAKYIRNRKDCIWAFFNGTDRPRE